MKDLTEDRQTLWDTYDRYHSHPERENEGRVGSTNLLRGAELCHCTVEHVEVVEEIDGYGDDRSLDWTYFNPSLNDSPWTASHSLRSSPSGSFTARRRFPEPL